MNEKKKEWHQDLYKIQTWTHYFSSKWSDVLEWLWMRLRRMSQVNEWDYKRIKEKKSEWHQDLNWISTLSVTQLSGRGWGWGRWVKSLQAAAGGWGSWMYVVSAWEVNWRAPSGLSVRDGECECLAGGEAGRQASERLARDKESEGSISVIISSSTRGGKEGLLGSTLVRVCWER